MRVYNLQNYDPVAMKYPPDSKTVKTLAIKNILRTRQFPQALNGTKTFR